MNTTVIWHIVDSLQLAKAYKILHGSVHSCDMWEGKHADMLFSWLLDKKWWYAKQNIKAAKWQNQLYLWKYALNYCTYVCHPSSYKYFW